MNKNLKIILNCIGITIITYIVVNTISFLIDFYQMEPISEWSFKWKHGTFFINSAPSGLQFGETKTYGFLLLIFFTTMILSYKKIKI